MPLRLRALPLGLSLVVAASFGSVAQAQVCVPPSFEAITNLTGGAHGGFDRIHQMARRSDGRVYVADGYRHRVRVYSSTGAYLESFGSTGSGLGQFDVPTGLVFDPAGNLYVAEQFNHRIQKFSPTHVPLAAFGTEGSGPGQLSYPTNLAISPDGARIYVTELLNHRISMFDLAGNFIGSFGGPGSGPGDLDLPFGIVVDSSGDVFVNGGRNHNVVHYDADGNFVASFGSFGTGPGQFNHPVGVGIDADENLYVTDQLNNRVHKLTRDGTPLAVFGSFGGGLGQMYNPWAVLPLPGGDVWVGDTFNFRIGVYGVTTPSPRIVSIADVPDDDGLQVRIRFLASNRDRTGSPTPVLQYEAYRRIEGAGAAAADEAARLRTPASEGAQPRTLDLAGWEFVGAVPAHVESEYNMVAPTLVDSKRNQVRWATYFVRAATSNPSVFYDACPDSGYSSDDHGPPTPAGFQATTASSSGDVTLSWSASAATDFDHFELHRGDVSYFTPSEATRIALLDGTAFDDVAAALGATRYYKLSAFDRAGNESGYAEASAGVPLDAPAGTRPLAYAFHPVEPNPASGLVSARLDLPAEDLVTVRVFDVNGRLVRALGERVVLPAGRHRWEWDGRDAGGAASPVGLYFVRLETPRFSRTRTVVRVE